MSDEMLENEEGTNTTISGVGGSMIEEEEVDEPGTSPDEEQNPEEPVETTEEKSEPFDMLGSENLAKNAKIFSTLAMQDMYIGDNTRPKKEEA